jgi:hypothetical protein
MLGAQMISSARILPSSGSWVSKSLVPIQAKSFRTAIRSQTPKWQPNKKTDHIVAGFATGSPRCGDRSDPPATNCCPRFNASTDHSDLFPLRSQFPLTRVHARSHGRVVSLAPGTPSRPWYWRTTGTFTLARFLTRSQRTGCANSFRK